MERLLRGPFGSIEDFDEFKLGTEEEAAETASPLFVERLDQPDGSIFARIVPLVPPAAAEPGDALPDKPPVAALDKPEPMEAGVPTAFVSARATARLTVLYIDAKGRDVLRQGGSRAWRNKNPGNISRGPFSKGAGAIGDDGRFAIFPDFDTGFAAIMKLLKTSEYRGLTLKQAIFRYAPPNENDSDRYVAALSQKTGIPAGQVLHTLIDAELRRFAEAIQAIEGWKPGVEQDNRPAEGSRPRADGTPGGIVSRGSDGWMDIARRQAALPEHDRSEWPGSRTNPRILEYFNVGSAWFEVMDDATDWCAAFVNFCLVTSGHIGTEHPGARSFFWNRKNQFVPLKAPVAGAIAVRRRAPFADPAWKTGPGHVGFVTAVQAGRLTLLGGNQSRTVCEQSYPMEEEDGAGRVTARFVAFLMPVTN